MMQAAMIFGRGIHEFMKAGVFGSKRSADGDEGAVAPRVPRDIDEFPGERVRGVFVHVAFIEAIGA